MAVSQKMTSGETVRAQVHALPKATSQDKDNFDYEKAQSVINIKVPQTVKNQLKAFFASRGLSLSRGLLLSALYLQKQYENDKVDVTIAGVLNK